MFHTGNLHACSISQLLNWALADPSAQEFSVEILYLLAQNPSPEHIVAITQVNLKQAQQIAAIFTLGKKLFAQSKPYITKINSPLAAYMHLNAMIPLEQEMIRALYLDNQLHLIHDQIIALGNLNTAYTDLKDILRPGLITNAYTFILAHNHPSGDHIASSEDQELTQKVANAGHNLGISLQDHLIITNKGFLSLRQSHAYLFGIAPSRSPLEA
ncbi:MAG: hypothetical protein HY817_01040 [Candidatus Abawacabacteria bacterium]|nr:hypothetical protein [Candidatus Abawacabacteria bacterium]